MNKTSNTRERARRRARQAKRGANAISFVLIGIGALAVILLVWNSFGRAPIGEQVPVSGEGEHVPDGNPLPAFSTDPPSSGPHYNTPLAEGFYDENSQEATVLVNPHGFIVHSLEHGYVVFWYDCAILDETACETLKTQIRTVMDSYDSYKIIAFPWTSPSSPLVATSWGRTLSFDTWDAELAVEFIERNRNRAPEPLAR